MTIKQVKLEDVIEDASVYPRTEVDGTQVRRVMDAIEAGETLPPIVLDHKGRIIDGWHRVAAARRLGWESIEAEVRKIPTDAGVLLAAVEANSAHGLRFHQWDMAKVVVRLEVSGVKRERIARALRVPVARVEGWSRNLAEGSKGMDVPMKSGLSHFAGRTLTSRQTEVNDRWAGKHPSYYAGQLVDYFDAGFFDPERGDDVLTERMERLVALWEKLRPKVTVSAG